jgi:hypothetical protein
MLFRGSQLQHGVLIPKSRDKPANGLAVPDAIDLSTQNLSRVGRHFLSVTNYHMLQSLTIRQTATAA